MIYAAKIIKDSNKYKNILSAPSSQSGNKRERADISGMSKKKYNFICIFKIYSIFLQKDTDSHAKREIFHSQHLLSILKQLHA